MPDNRTTPTIMLVDDDEMVLDSIKAFFSIESDYNLLTYTSAAAALETLDHKHQNIDLVISDYLMPGMDGITFLAHVKERMPMVPRITRGRPSTAAGLRSVSSRRWAMASRS